MEQLTLETKLDLIKWRQYESAIILLTERGLKIYHTTIMRWVHELGPEIDKRIRSYLKPSNDSWRMDETYIKVKGQDQTLKGIEALHMIRKGQAENNSSVLSDVEWLNKIFGIVA
ncbi:hypothetical protein BC351_34395 [Paenibacillus ferrarius]|uniref:DDE domain-containing protein n=1 Tax=Paenibacillus ferrarius TaxID=1469647 RepID=A0A1V4HDJ7_9BACL|nr:hypothetical protein BC351_34395 [Paenibacillus ferrarius]